MSASENATPRQRWNELGALIGWDGDAGCV